MATLNMMNPMENRGKRKILTFKVHSELLSYLIHTALKVIGSIFLQKKEKRVGLKKRNSITGLMSVKGFLHQKSQCHCLSYVSRT